MDRSFYLAFSNFPGIGPQMFKSLIKTFGSAKEAYGAPVSSLTKIVGEKRANTFDKFRQKFDIKGYEKFLKNKKISYVCLGEKEYPTLLSQIPNPPILLYVKGDKTLLNYPEKLEYLRIVAIVGTRKMTGYGQEITDLFSSNLAQSGFVIVSGMALGVDGQAHKSCLDVGGKTIAVLGNGVDLPFPSSNASLYNEILKKGGAIISELPPGEPPAKGTFPSRNRIIAGLSQAVLVTQGAEDSGSMITANLALKFGRPVFAVPGPITSSLSKGPNDLIRRGAKLVYEPKDILNELGTKNYELRKEGSKFDGLNKDERKIVELLMNENLSFDEIAKRLKLPASKIGTILSMMEINGVVKNNGGEYSLS